MVLAEGIIAPDEVFIDNPEGIAVNTPPKVPDKVTGCSEEIVLQKVHPE